MSTDNPFTSPEGGHQPNYEAGQGVQARSSVDYLEIFGKVFEHPNWFVNILLTGLVAFIPFIGAIVINGFGINILHARSTGQTNSYPNFDFNNFGDYLVRGLWMFLVGIVVTLGLLPVFVIDFGVLFIAQATRSDALVMIAFLFHIIFVFGLSVLLNLFIVPILIRAGMRSSFGEAFDFAWIKDFVSKMWLEQILGLIIWGVISWFITVVGMLAFCIGIIPAIGVVFIAYWNFLTQLYQVYVSRGGQPIPFQANT
ncbi:DUF4013 domain-containing protein [Blastopirellula marina]|uniref:DUF4013 domain-containing protein n=1 Tax=Blastopirellula marina TaxID=124 RepID=A0A2S8GJB3_9BACT|nr:DUF4013 domain-containing protein [Blastopirellula marina]PQO44516.1 hypothetical protein C5Y93_19100 [Blastopirellula marina]